MGGSRSIIAKKLIHSSKIIETSALNDRVTANHQLQGCTHVHRHVHPPSTPGAGEPAD